MMIDHKRVLKTSAESAICTLLLQVVHVEWSKAARGGVLASARNQVPEAFPLVLPSTPAGPSYLIHHIFYSEADSFQHPYYDALEVKSANERTHYASERRRFHALFVMIPHTAVIQSEVPGEEMIRYDRISLNWKADTVTGNYRHIDGAPYSTRSRFILQQEQWIRVRYNARYSVDAGWVYDKWVFNIGLFKSPSPDVFLTTIPTKQYSYMSQLR
jgi:hypothetical protein